MILAHYCSRTVFEEQMDIIDQNGTKLLPRNWLRLVSACTSFLRVELRLFLYEYYVSLRHFFNMTPAQGI